VDAGAVASVAGELLGTGEKATTVGVEPGVAAAGASICSSFIPVHEDRMIDPSSKRTSRRVEFLGGHIAFLLIGPVDRFSHPRLLLVSLKPVGYRSQIIPRTFSSVTVSYIAEKERCPHKL
jgi:hypothetical protein